jgi:excisionase family DNA binding protein
MIDPEMLGLRECAERLGVHYMTAYRYVRTGMLPASKLGSEWRVSAEDLEHFRATADQVPGHAKVPRLDRFEARLVAGDEGGAWQIIEGALASGMTPQRVYVEMLGPAMHRIGEGWSRGTRSIADEHRASVVAHRLVGRLGARFRIRGRPKGRIVLGTPAGERHALPPAVIADLLRGAGFEVVDLGSDLPIDDFVAACRSVLPLVAVGLSVSTTDALTEAATLIESLRSEDLGPILLGGAAIWDAHHAERLGADLFAENGAEAVEMISSLGGIG